METILVNQSNLNADTIYSLFNELEMNDKQSVIDKIFKRTDFLKLIKSFSKNNEMTFNQAVNWFNKDEPQNGLSETEVIDIVKEVRKQRYATA